VIRRVVEQLNCFANFVGKFAHTIEELGSYTAAFWAIVNFDLDEMYAAKRFIESLSVIKSSAVKCRPL
jgi:hypothetical protein